jgi:hypothetical protein
MVVDAPWYVPNTVIRMDLQIPTVTEEIRRYSSQYSARLSAHPNDLIVNFMELPDNRRPISYCIRFYIICWMYWYRLQIKWDYIQWNLYKAKPHGTENIFHIGQISALYKINNTDSSDRDYRICSHWASFRLIQVPHYTSFTVLRNIVGHERTSNL